MKYWWQGMNLRGYIIGIKELYAVDAKMLKAYLH